MLFSEIYGSYFHVVSAILDEATKGCLSDKRMTELVSEKAFAESILTIPSALKSGMWPLLKDDLSTVIRHSPTMPLTLLQKRWLKTLLQDPRIALFAPDPAGLEDIEPLYQADSLVFFDQYSDGDPFEDAEYIKNFRTVLQAIREKKALRIRFRDRSGSRHSFVCLPHQLEYSAKDDKFRLLSFGKRNNHTINLARVKSCTILEPLDNEERFLPKSRTCELTMLLHDERNGLERVLLHFSHFEKETQKLDNRLYQIKLRYDPDDETELLIRVLSFGPVLEVIAPHTFTSLIKQRLALQNSLLRG